MFIEPGDLLVWRDWESEEYELGGKYALVLEVIGDNIVAEFYPSGNVQEKSLTGIQFWYQKVDDNKNK